MRDRVDVILQKLIDIVPSESLSRHHESPFMGSPRYRHRRSVEMPKVVAQKCPGREARSPSRVRCFDVWNDAPMTVTPGSGGERSARSFSRLKNIRPVNALTRIAAQSSRVFNQK